MVQKFDFNDYELIYLYREGNERAFDVLLDKYSKIIAKYLINKIELSYVSDFIQEASIILYDCIQLYDEKKGSFFSYFFTSFMNYYSKEIRKIKLYESITRIKDISKLSDTPRIRINGFHYIEDEMEIFIFDEVILKGNNLHNISIKNNLSYYKLKAIYNNLIDKLKKIYS